MTDDELPIREPRNLRDVDRKILWINVRPIPGDDGAAIRNMLALTYQADPRDVKVR